MSDNFYVNLHCSGKLSFSFSKRWQKASVMRHMHRWPSHPHACPVIWCKCLLRNSRARETSRFNMSQYSERMCVAADCGSFWNASGWRHSDARNWTTWNGVWTLLTELVDLIGPRKLGRKTQSLITAGQALRSENMSWLTSRVKEGAVTVCSQAPDQWLYSFAWSQQPAATMWWCQGESFHWSSSLV